MKELTFHEVLQIAGGLPDAASLDELSYRLPPSPPADPLTTSAATEAHDKKGNLP